MRKAATGAFTVVSFVVLLASVPLHAGEAHRASHRAFHGTDDWQFDPTAPLDELLTRIECVGGAFSGNPLVPCTEGSQIRLRGLPSASIVQTSDPRFSGRMLVEANGNLDPSYAGPVWGTFDLQLGSDDGSWQGIWYGVRRFFPDGTGGGRWVATLRLVGYGTGSAEGGVLTATAKEYSLTALPVPYEALSYLGVPGVCTAGGCPPEGVLKGRFFVPRGH